jgi:hypothetical protein
VGATGSTGATGPKGTFFASTGPLSSPQEGDTWFNSITGKTYIYYDANWVQIGNALVGAGQITLDIQEFDVADTWYKPQGAILCYIEGCGGGGGGATAKGGGTGGSAGVFNDVWISVNIPSTFDIVIGAGGTAGNNGGASTVMSSGNTYLYCEGGLTSSTVGRNIIGTNTTGGFGAGGAVQNAGRHGGRGPGGGGGGGGTSGNTNGSAGGKSKSIECIFTNALAAVGGGASGGIGGTSPTAGSDASIDVLGYGKGAGGGGGNPLGFGANGGKGIRGSGGGGAGGGGTAPGTGGTGGDGFIRIVTFIKEN